MKKMTIILVTAVMVGLCISIANALSFSSTPSFKPASAPGRTLVIISDLHLGLGKNSDGSWYRTEDFRWPKALKSFLDEISRRGNNRVDLIIAGDFLDMWQPPASIPFEGAGPDLGGTPEEMKAIASWIVKAHPEVFEGLRVFIQKGENRLHIIPGNHDAALLIAPVWEPIGKALGADGGRVNFVVSGVWVSPDGKIVVEHGHQIGNENRYETWPNIVNQKNGKEYLIRPWGERFVQKIFNDQEEEYPIIDNLSPESAGVWYRMKERGIQGNAIDVARFVVFNLFQTSLTQKGEILGADKSHKDKAEWDITEARKLGHRLFLAALPQDDPLRAQLTQDNEKTKETIRELDLLASDAKQLPDENVKMLCDLAANQGNPICAPELGAVIKKLVPRERIFATYLSLRQKEFPRMQYFIYGHTHLFEEAWPPEGDVQILNSGAFHRVIDQEEFINQVRLKGISPSEGLKKISLDELPPSYTFILISYKTGGPKPEVLRWVMKESDATGRTVNP